MTTIDFTGQVALPEGVVRVKSRHVLRKYGLFNIRMDGRVNGRRFIVDQAGTGYVNTWNMACVAFEKEKQRVAKRHDRATKPSEPSREGARRDSRMGDLTSADG